jgi:integrase
MNASPRMRDGGERRYIAFNLKHFREMLLKDIDQAALDNAAETLVPTAAPDYRNRKVYTPVIAILRQALGDKCPTFRRPKGSKGTERKGFMWPEDAFDVIDEAEKDDPEFGLYLFSLLYTGIRKSEGLDALKVDMRPEDLALWLRDSKNGDPRMLRLRQDIADRFQTHLKTLPEGRERLFRFRDGGTFQTQAAARHDGRLWPTVPQAPADRVEAAGIPAALRDLPYLPSHLGDLDAHVRRR